MANELKKASEAMEPQSAFLPKMDSLSQQAAVSIAISLKRIADVLEASTYKEKEGERRALRMAAIPTRR